MSEDDPHAMTTDYRMIGGSLDGHTEQLLTALKRVPPGKGAVKLNGERYVYDAARDALVYEPEEVEG